MTPEGKVKKRIKEWIASKGGWYTMPVHAGSNGVPDFICCINGLFVAIEAKAPGRRGEKNRGCSGLQVLQIKAIKEAGGIAVVVDGEDDLKSLEEVLR